MAGILMAMLGGQGFRVVGGNFGSICAGTTAAPQGRFQSDGSVLLRQSDLSYLTSQWGDPVIAGIGASYWIKATLGAGTATVGGDATGTILRLDVERSWSIAAAPLGGSNTRTLSYQIFSDAAGTTVVGSGNLTLQSDRT